MSEKDAQLLQKIYNMIKVMEDRLAVVESMVTKEPIVSDNVKEILAAYKSDFLSVSQLTKHTGYSVAGIREKIHAEEIYAEKIANGKNWKIPKSEVERILTEAKISKKNNTGEFKKVLQKHKSAA